MSSIITLLTDFGIEDYYVPAMKGTLLRLSPDSRVVDISHLVPPGDVAIGAFLLAAAVPSFPSGTVHLAVVDPGVGGVRRLLAVRTDSATLLGPDNGLLSQFLDRGELRAIDRPDLYLAGPSETFHGKDRLAPVAAALARGEPFESLGRRVTDGVRLAIDPPWRRGEELGGEVVHIDRFGNLVTNIPAAWLPKGPVSVLVDAKHTVRRRARSYEQLVTGVPGIVVGSLGTLELSLKQDSLAARWGARRGARVVVSRQAGDADQG